MRSNFLILGFFIIGSVFLFHAIVEFSGDSDLLWNNSSPPKLIIFRGFSTVIEDWLGPQRARWLFAYWWAITGGICFYVSFRLIRKK